MGQKVNPHGFRVGVNQQWDSQWYANKKNFSDLLVADDQIRKFIKKKYYESAISKITIERSLEKLTVNIWTGRPSVLIGKDGANVVVIRDEVKAFCAPNAVININIHEVRRPDSDAQLVAENIAAQLEKRSSFRRTMKQAMSKAMKSGAKGIKTMVSGRLDGAEIARRETYHEGSIPLQTLRADIEYGFAQAHTTFGVIGVKCWIYKGENFGKLNEGGRD